MKGFQVFTNREDRRQVAILIALFLAGGAALNLLGVMRVLVGGSFF